MADNIACVDYLLSSSNTWEALNTLSLILSYSSTLVCGRNRIKMEPISDSDFVENDIENSNNLNMQQEDNDFESEVCTKMFNNKHKLIRHKKMHTGKNNASVKFVIKC